MLKMWMYPVKTAIHTESTIRKSLNKNMFTPLYASKPIKKGQQMTSSNYVNYKMAKSRSERLYKRI